MELALEELAAARYCCCCACDAGDDVCCVLDVFVDVGTDTSGSNELDVSSSAFPLASLKAIPLFSTGSEMMIKLSQHPSNHNVHLQRSLLFFSKSIKSQAKAIIPPPPPSSFSFFFSFSTSPSSLPAPLRPLNRLIASNRADPPP